MKSDGLIERLTSESEKKDARIHGLTVVVWILCAALCFVLALAAIGGG